MQGLYKNQAYYYVWLTDGLCIVPDAMSTTWHEFTLSPVEYVANNKLRIVLD